MDLVLQISQKARYLDEYGQLFLLKIIDAIVAGEDDLSAEDLYHIVLGEQELARGETISHSDRKWKE